MDASMMTCVAPDPLSDCDAQLADAQFSALLATVRPALAQEALDRVARGDLAFLPSYARFETGVVHVYGITLRVPGFDPHRIPWHAVEMIILMHQPPSLEFRLDRTRLEPRFDWTRVDWTGLPSAVAA